MVQVKKLKLLCLCESDKIEEAKKSGADIVGSDDLLKKLVQENLILQN